VKNANALYRHCDPASLALCAPASGECGHPVAQDALVTKNNRPYRSLARPRPAVDNRMLTALVSGTRTAPSLQCSTCAGPARELRVAERFGSRRVGSLRIMPEERTTVLCPSCKKRMRIRQITQATSDDARNLVYNCAMCDIEIKQPAPHASNEYAVGRFDFFCTRPQ
jgi:hypothetical protein